jgi:hypothetical protein
MHKKRHYLWRALDQDGVVLAILVQTRRNKQAATQFVRKLLTGCQYGPRVIITDKLKREILPGVYTQRSSDLLPPPRALLGGPPWLPHVPVAWLRRWYGARQRSACGRLSTARLARGLHVCELGQARGGAVSVAEGHGSRNDLLGPPGANTGKFTVSSNECVINTLERGKTSGGGHRG